ncbi:MAG TPA: hypothetical protein VLN49_24445, partial [Gemmatimonadaceae bacterium]|nr:hypothetical protein [Gemmatimonadaceae bacterium]
MTSTMNRVSTDRRARNLTGRLLPLLLTASLVAAGGTPIRAQQSPSVRMWAAQTAPNQVTLAWEEIPGAVEYRIYAGDPDTTTNPAARRPISTLSGSGRGGIITGMNRVSSGLYLEAVGRDRRRIRKLAFNAVTPNRAAQVVTAPAEATATATGDTAITLSWTAVPGATAYILGRAVSPGGFRMLCALCSTDPKYVDRDVMPGAGHSYTVTAVFPSGVSPRTLSNIVTPGAAVAAAGSTGTSGTAVPTGSTSTGQTTPTTSYTPPGQPAGTTTSYTPPGQPAGSTSSSTTAGTTTPTAQTTATTAGTEPSQAKLAPLQLQLDSLRSLLAPYTSGFQVQSTTAADSAMFSRLLRQIDSLRTQAATMVGGILTLGPTDSTALRQTLAVFVQRADSLRSSVVTILGNLFQGPMATTQPVTHTATPVWTGPCRLDYQRADNMWAAFGKPTGTLGTETISLADGQAKLFFTDWKYEKQRNDGSNYYGSHLRIATNPGTRPLKLQIQISLSSGWVTINAGETKQFQSDLA